MTVFISYARADQAAAEQLRADVQRCHRDAWVDQELTGGQAWWRTILDHVRRCDVFLVVLSPQWMRSKACDLELRYAVAIGRPVLPVMVARVDPRLTPPAVADAQIVSYLERSPEATFALRDALDTLPAAPPLPSPLPDEPAAPISYLHNVILKLNDPVLEPGDQRELWQQLRAALDEAGEDPGERPELLELARRFRRRPDLVPELRGEVDDALGPAPAPVTPPAATPSRSRRILAVGGAAVVAATVSTSVWLVVTAGDGRDPAGPATTTSSTAHPVDTFTIPSLWSSRAVDAELALRSVGWVGSLSRRVVTVSDRNQDGIVLGQDPRAGAEVPRDVAVTVTVGVFGSG